MPGCFVPPRPSSSSHFQVARSRRSPRRHRSLLTRRSPPSTSRRPARSGVAAASATDVRAAAAPAHDPCGRGKLRSELPRRPRQHHAAPSTDLRRSGGLRLPRRPQGHRRPRLRLPEGLCRRMALRPRPDPPSRDRGARSRLRFDRPAQLRRRRRDGGRRATAATASSPAAAATSGAAPRDSHRGGELRSELPRRSRQHDAAPAADVRRPGGLRVPRRLQGHRRPRLRLPEGLRRRMALRQQSHHPQRGGRARGRLRLDGPAQLRPGRGGRRAPAATSSSAATGTSIATRARHPRRRRAATARTAASPAAT